MKRTAATMLATLALAAVNTAPATAATTQPPGVVVVSGIRACVTTTWRAQHTHQANTHRGELCYITGCMWIPSSYHRIGIRLSDDGSNAYEVYQRPW